MMYWFVLVTLVASACGGSGDENAARTKDVDAELRECLERSGQDPSLENVETRRQNEPDFARAVDDCAKEIGVEDLLTPPSEESVRAGDEQLLAMLDCLRQAGWEVPPPTRSAEGNLNVEEEINQNVPPDQQDDFFADFERCGGPPAPAPGSGQGSG
jgi:hypothetical protein